MIYTIENEFLKVDVNEMGAELFSLYSKVTKTEYLWQGDEAHWGDKAINLFPYIGRMVDKIYTYKGTTYPSRTHGLARYFPFALESRTENSLTFLLTDSEETKKEYPFSFAFRVTFLLEGYKLTIGYAVENTDTRTLICAFGGHPGFNVPFGKGNFEDYYLEFTQGVQPMHQLLSPKKFMANQTAPFPLVDGAKVPLTHELFADDAVILENAGTMVALKSSKDNRYVSMQYDGFPFFGFWQAYANDTPYVCLEPWTSLPATDGEMTALENKKHMYHVPAGENASVAYSVEIHE